MNSIISLLFWNQVSHKLVICKNQRKHVLYGWRLTFPRKHFIDEESSSFTLNSLNVCLIIAPAHAYPVYVLLYVSYHHAVCVYV